MEVSYNMSKYKKGRFSNALKASAMLTSAAVPLVASSASNTASANFSSDLSRYTSFFVSLPTSVKWSLLGGLGAAFAAKILWNKFARESEDVEKIIKQAVSGFKDEYKEYVKSELEKNEESLAQIKNWDKILISMNNRQKNKKGAPSEINLEFSENAFDLSTPLKILRNCLACGDGFKDGFWVLSSKEGDEENGFTSAKLKFMTLNDYIDVQREAYEIKDVDGLHDFKKKDDEISIALGPVSSDYMGTFYSLFSPFSLFNTALVPDRTGDLDFALVRLETLVNPNNSTLTKDNREYARKILSTVRLFKKSVENKLKKIRTVKTGNNKKRKNNNQIEPSSLSTRIREIISDRNFYEGLVKSRLDALNEGRYGNSVADRREDREDNLFYAKTLNLAHVGALAYDDNAGGKLEELFKIQAKLDN